MQSKTTLFIVISAVIVVLLIVGLVSMPASDAHNASRDLRKVTSEASQLWQEAEGLLGSSVYLSPAGEHWPKAGPIDQSGAGGIRHARPEAVNPLALPPLTKADEILTAALERCAAADPTDRAMALRLAARIDSLTGLYYERKALTSKMAGDAADEADGGLALLLADARRQTDELNQLVRLLDGYLGEADDDVSVTKEALAKADVERTAAIAELTDQRQKTQGFKDTVEALTAKIDELSVQAAEHRAAARAGGTAAEELALLTKAQVIEADILALRNDIEGEERKIELAEDREGALTLEVAAAITRVDDLTKSVEKLDAENAQARSDATKTRGEIDALLRQFDKTLGHLSDELAEAADAQEKATTHRDEAIKSLEAAGQIGGEATAESVVNEAVSRAAMADLLADRVRIQRRVDGLVAYVETVCQTTQPAIDAPGNLALLQAHLVDGDDAGRRAASLYARASEQFVEAAGIVDVDDRAALQAQAAVAEYGRYRVTEQEAALKKAQQLLKAAQAGAKDPRLVDMIKGINIVGLDEEAPSEE